MVIAEQLAVVRILWRQLFELVCLSADECKPGCQAKERTKGEDFC
jgi:hypothetical protein